MLPAVYILVALLLMPCNKSSAHQGRYNCLIHKNVTASIGVIIDRSTRVGREQEIAMKIAVQNIYRDSCVKLNLHIRDSSQSSSPVTSTALKLIHNKKVQAIIGTFSLPEAAVLSDVLKNFLEIPVIFLSPRAVLAPSVPTPASNLIQMANSLWSNVQCLASIIKYFHWQKVIVIYESSNTFSLDSEVVSVLSDSLKSINSIVERRLAFPPIGSLSDPEIVVEKELIKLRDGGNRIFVVLQSSLELANCVLRKAHHLGMVEKGFVWIISDEIASLLDSVDLSVIASMQGVIGCKTSFVDTSESYKRFKAKFERSYLAKYSDDQGNPNPSLFALRAYDAVHIIGKAKLYSNALLHNVLFGKFVGLTGNMSFRNGMLEKQPVFRIINVVGNGYKELACWSSAYGLSKKSHTQSGGKDDRMNENDISFKLGPIFWPGGQQTIPKGLSFGVSNENKPLRIGVPASGAFHQFVNVSVDKVHNRTLVTGFAVDVFRASLKYLPYDLPFALVPFYGTYDELVHEIHRKGFDAAVGDINILEERYKWADFSQPYTKSGMVMVVTVKEAEADNMWMFLMVFDSKMWVAIPSMGLFVGFVVCLIEHSDSPDFGGSSFFRQTTTVFWFCFSLLFFSQKESPKSSLSKIVLAPWHFLVLLLTIYFTAALTSLMTVSQLTPSVKDVATLRSENAAVGCNWNSFLCPYLVDVLQFKLDNIRPLKSTDDYHTAFQRGEIKAAFFVTSHAKVFLAKYCNGYTIAGPTYYFGGLSFAFPKGSPLSIDMSQAMLKAIERGEIEMLERELYARYKCSASTTNDTSTSVGLRPFSGLLYISGGIASVALLVTIIPAVDKRWRILGVIQEVVKRRLRFSLIFSRT